MTEDGTKTKTVIYRFNRSWRQRLSCSLVR
jgi:hypothetical protein